MISTGPRLCIFPQSLSALGASQTKYDANSVMTRIRLSALVTVLTLNECPNASGPFFVPAPTTDPETCAKIGYNKYLISNTIMANPPSLTFEKHQIILDAEFREVSDLLIAIGSPSTAESV